MANPIIVLEVFDPFQKSLSPTTDWEPLGGGWHQEPPTPQALSRNPKAEGKQWQIHQFPNDDSARVAHIINQLMPKAPEGKLVLHNKKIALARKAVPEGYKQLKGLPAERHRERMAGLHALLNTSPEHFEHFAPKGDDSAKEIHSRSTGKGLFNHLNEEKKWPSARQLVSHLAGEIPSEALTQGVKDAVELSDDRLEDAIGDAGLVPEEADSLLEKLKSRREDLRKLLDSGELPGDSNENKAFAAAHDPENYERGPLVGAPPKVKTPADRVALKKQLGQLADKGAFGAGWYRDSAKAVHDRFGGNLPKIQKYLALLAAYSPQQTPNPNTEAAERAWQHHEEGLPEETLRGGGTNMQDDQARALLYHDHWHSGLKTNAFYRNLWHYVTGGTDRPPTADEIARGELQPVTIDRWAARSVGYPIQLGQKAQEGEAKERTVSRSNYRFSRQLLNEVAHEKQLSAHELQERMWVAEKGGALARKNLITAYAKAKGESVNDLTKQVNAGNIPADLKRPLENVEIDPKAMAASKESFATGLHELGGHVVADLTPDPSMLDTSQHSHEHKQELHNRLLEALHKDKRLRAAEMLGVGGAPAKVGASGHLYAGAVMPRSLISEAEKEGVSGGDLALMRGQITPNSLRRIRGMAHGLAHLLGQKSIEFHRPVHVQGFRQEDMNGTSLPTGELAPHELHDLQQALSQKLGTPTVPVPHGDGVYVVNHSKLSNDDFHKAVQAVAQEVLSQPQVSTIGGAAGRMRKRPDIVAGRFYAPGERLEESIEGHRRRAIAALGPALSRRFFAEHTPLLGPVYEQYAREHGIPLNLPSTYSAGEEEAPKKRKKVAALKRAWGWLTQPFDVPSPVIAREPFAARSPNEAREPSNVRNPDDERDTPYLRPRFPPTQAMQKSFPHVAAAHQPLEKSLISEGAIADAVEELLSVAARLAVQRTVVMVKAFMYHGTPYDVPHLEPDRDHMIIDRAVGTHFAADPEVSKKFAEGLYRKQTDSWTGKTSWEGGRMPSGPGNVFKTAAPSRSQLEEVPQARYRHSRRGAERYSYPQPGAKAGAYTTDQHAIAAHIHATVMSRPENKGMFVSWLQHSRGKEYYPDEEAGRIHDQLSQGKPAYMKADKHYAQSFHHLFRNYSTVGQGPYKGFQRDVVNKFLDIMRQKGKVGLTYKNTSPMETKGIRSNKSYIIFHPQHLKLERHESPGPAQGAA